MLELQTLDTLRKSQPFYVYKRVMLTSPEGYFFQAIDYGYWYLLRKIHVQYPEIDPAGAVFYPTLNVYMVEKGQNTIPQNVAIPFDLFCTPGNTGIQTNALNQMTSTGPKNAKLQNKIFPFRDNIELYISGQNPIGNPPFVDITLIGYLIPANDQYQWSERKKQYA